MARRRVAYISGSRADFGLMKRTLAMIHGHAAMELSIVVTGMHLDPTYGRTLTDIEASGLPIGTVLPIEEGTPSGALTARNIGKMVVGFATAFAADKPDIVLLLGDRGEMLAAAVAAIHLNIPVAHVHGGERSGTVDEPVRHAISKLSHLHLVATDESRRRLVRMGEDDRRVLVVGAPGIDGLREDAALDVTPLFAKYGLSRDDDLALFVYHPVLQDGSQSGVAAENAVRSLLDTGLQVLALQPNSDSGAASIGEVLDRFSAAGEVRLATHMERPEYLSLLAHAAVLVGNSSSGIIEAATFGTPVVNIGSRQYLRERNANVIDVDTSRSGIAAGLKRALSTRRFATTNVYGDGRAASRIVAALLQLDVDDPGLMAKVNAY